MLFNSVDFALFLPIVFILYWVLLKKSVYGQNLLILTASYFFYGVWDWRFLILIAFSSLVDFFAGLLIASSENKGKKKVFLALSLTVNLGLLFTFKYFNFFIDSFSKAISFLGREVEIDRLDLILPVGISFYTFQTLSYSIDVYRSRIKPERNLLSFFTFVSFFPQLAAGPIERASNLLPQFSRRRHFSYLNGVSGMRQILSGLFKKVVIADSCAEYVNFIFENPSDHSGLNLILGAVLFGFQIYGDFSGYSDIAIGTARLFGFELMDNFAFPYFSRDIAEFWRRWHISLSTWFRDYVYIPLGGSQQGKSKTIRNIFIIFLVSGLWHGANWTFIVWGLINAFYFLPLMIRGKNRRYLDKISPGSHLPEWREFWSILTTFFLTSLAWVFFRADNLSGAVQYLKSMVLNLDQSPQSIVPNLVVGLLIIFIIAEWFQRNSKHLFDFNDFRPSTIFRWSIYLIATILIAMFFGKSNAFIYFQF